jgi:hypothetical protein
VPALDAYRAAVRRLVGETSPRSASELERVLEVLLEGFEPGWLERNQKFDFSISDGSRGAALSVNDFGEKDAFDAKILAVFDLFTPAYDRGAAARMLEAVRALKPLHQTTFGLDWPAGADRPRLKIYLEELRHRYPKAARLALLERVRRAAGLPESGLPADEDLAAMCVDFFPDGRQILKTYAYRQGDAPESAGAPFRGFLRAMSAEPRCFYYRTLRYASGGAVESEKLYKVYEVRQIDDFSPGFGEIGAALGKSPAADRLEEYRELASRWGGSLYPVLCALDQPADGGKPRIDAYFSVR